MAVTVEPLVVSATPDARFADRSGDPFAPGRAVLLLDVLFANVGRSFVLEVPNGVLHHRERTPSVDANGAGDFPGLSAWRMFGA